MVSPPVTGKSEDSLVDEWIFSIRLPNDAPTSASGYGGLLQMRQPQPPHPSVRAQDGDRASSDSSEHKEQESLLQSRSGETSPRATHLGWSFSSPFWKVQSKFVLKVTYRPSWQAIPEFTECRACASNAASTGSKRSNSYLRSVGSYCCGGGCGCKVASIAGNVDFYAYTWTTADIVHAETLDSVQIEGLGVCQAIRLTLSPLLLSDDFPRDLPPYLRQAWEAHQRRVGESTQSSAQVAAPTITYCLPLSQIDPPLVWKVQFPNLEDENIALETYSILDGQLSSAPEEPTHIYLNGFQSWSFAGSIVRGHEQPQPALPKAFSRAFNLGGSAPPPALQLVSDATATEVKRSGADAKSLFSCESVQSSAETPAYQSDFFTCITSDGQLPHERKRNLVETAMAKAARSPHGSPPPSVIEEEPFPFQKLDETGGPAVLLGWLAQRKQFGVITADRNLKHIAMHSSADGTLLLGKGGTNMQQETDWAYLQLISPHSYDEEPLVHYLHAVAAHNHARPLQNGSLLTGWCSWYHYYNDITGSNLRENFTKLAAMQNQVPTNVAVVDDGYMTAWGDWDSLKPKKFSGGMHNVARDIESNGMRPGIWLAPFAADKHSKATASGANPDWVIHNDFGAPANSGNCGKFFYGLDATNPYVRDHAHEAIRRAVEDWKYNVLKIDFLYAACLEGNGKYDLSVSRAQAMHMALDTIRDAAGPNVFLIGCGCPIATAVGYVDGMRISADTGPTWYPAPPLPWWDHGTLPSLRSMVRNSMSRAPMGHRWWHNDPDCLLLGESTRLTDVEVASAASVVAMTCGMMLLSDDLTKVSPARTKILTKIFPMTGASAVVLDLHSTNDGLPSLLRLWATDNHDHEFDQTSRDSATGSDHNHEATFFARKASFLLDVDLPPPNERKRSCIYAAKGLGSWTVISISNWSDKAAVLNIPPPALLTPPSSGFDESEADTFLDAKPRDDNGYHVLAFWSSKYTWLPPQPQAAEQPLSRRLNPHETEIFHVKRVSPEVPQYIGSDLHFSCCKEVLRFESTNHQVDIALKADYDRVGRVFVFLPVINTDSVRVTVHGEPGRWASIGNTPRVAENGSPRLVGRVIQVMVNVQSGNPESGRVSIEY